MEEEDNTLEVYAAFGYVIHLCQNLEMAIVDAIIHLDHIPRLLKKEETAGEEKPAAELLEEIEAFALQESKKPLGGLLKSFEKASMPVAWAEWLNDMRIVRNFLAHEFFAQHADKLETSEGRDTLLTILRVHVHHFEHAIDTIDELVQAYQDSVDEEPRSA